MKQKKMERDKCADGDQGRYGRESWNQRKRGEWRKEKGAVTVLCLGHVLFLGNMGPVTVQTLKPSSSVFLLRTQVFGLLLPPLIVFLLEALIHLGVSTVQHEDCSITPHPIAFQCHSIQGNEGKSFIHLFIQLSNDSLSKFEENSSVGTLGRNMAPDSPTPLSTLISLLGPHWVSGCLSNTPSKPLLHVLFFQH